MSTNFEHLGDSELFRLMDSDDRTAQNAFRELYIRYSPRVYAYCRRFLSTKEEAEDALQEIFVRFYESRKQQRDMSNIAAYLLRIAHNACFNIRRNDKKTVEYNEYMALDDDNRTEKDDLLNLIKTALELLPIEYREVFILREYDGMTYQEIAEVLNIQIGTVKIRLYRSKERIREILQPYLAEISKYE